MSKCIRTSKVPGDLDERAIFLMLIPLFWNLERN
jgi:hypothetical protein